MATAKKKDDAIEISEAELVIEAAPVAQIIAETEAITEAAAAETAEVQDAKPTAKAGKRSAKALEAADEKQAKEERKASGDDEADKPKQTAKPARSKLERQGKKFRDRAKLIDKSKTYTLDQAVELAQQTSPVKFDATVELHVNLNVDPRQADQNIRDNLVLPAGSGKTVRVAVFDDAAVEGADIAGIENVMKALDKGDLNFDVLIATPAQMPKLGKYARTLGPRGLMPNPKSGTVTNDVAKAVAEAKAGKVEYRVDSTGIVHLGVGKVSFTSAQLQENLQAVMASLKAAKPSSIKGVYIKSVHLTTSMGPSVSIDLASIS